ncbi:unnamed protein product [Mytilus edulis]|uniref:Uncharacterized protein n=1 Tax=Mytilus edulis TaxID=6550 RepID=A0A8S3S4S3_MYTED|nr:unnamed protein product [Mytilus edulis]
MKLKVKAAPKTSSYAESVFGQLDHLIRTRPSTKTLAAEACIMFLNNKTLSWLESKDTQEQQELMKKASKGVKNLRDKKEVLNQIPDDKSVFNFTKTKEGTKSRKNLTVEELITNLKMLVRQSIVRDNLDESDKHVLVGKRVKHRFDTNGEDQLYTGKVISQVPAFPEWFNIVYDEDRAVYTYHHQMMI